MSRGLQMKLALVIVLIGWAIYELAPTFQYWPMSKDDRQALQIADKAKFDWLQVEAIKRGLDLQGGVFLVLEVDPSNTLRGGELVDAVEGARRVIDQRVNQWGVSEANVQKIGERRLIVELPGLEDIEAAMNLVGRTAHLRFSLLRPVAERDEVIRRIDGALPRLIGEAGFSVADTVEGMQSAAEKQAAAEEGGLFGADKVAGADQQKAGQAAVFEPGEFEPADIGVVEPKAETSIVAEEVVTANPLIGITSLSGLLQTGYGNDYYVSPRDRPKVEAVREALEKATEDELNYVVRVAEHALKTG